MNSCDGCGVLEIFADLKRIPAIFVFTHPLENQSTPAHWYCMDEHGCVRRSRMRMQPGRGLFWGNEMTRHVLIECAACGEEGTAQGVREVWLEGDPFPVHAFVCASCGAECARSKWVDLETHQSPQR